MQKEFMVIGRANATTRQGSPYALLKVTDAEQSFSVSVWDVAPDMAPFPGQLVQFVQVKDFGGKKSCSIADMVLGLMADEKHPVYGLIPRPINRKVWDDTIANLLSFCTDSTLVPIIQDFAGKLYKPYSEYPAATTVHHAYQGGLLNHTHQMLHMLEGLYPCLPYQIKVERCILAILFHDYGKVYEYNRQGDTQPDMYLLGHIYILINLNNYILDLKRLKLKSLK